MKHSILHLVLICCLILGVSCSSDDAPSDLQRVREVAWNSLDEETRETVITDWREANIELQDYRYFVFFNTTDDAILGPIGVIVNSSTFEVEGQVPRF